MQFHDAALAVANQDNNIPAGFRPVADLNLVIVVGLTGVGKSTVIDLLADMVDFTLLPNRREITDHIIIATLQQADGQTPYTVSDRVKRFEYTARYRALHRGGMAYALGQLLLNPSMVEPLLVFDGLRGLDEVQYAAEIYTKARFLVLDAPDSVRLGRLLKREDRFDTTQLVTPLSGSNLIAALLAIPDIEAIFSEEELQQISRTARAARRTIDEVVKKTAIIVEERRNYDSRAARVHLTHHLPEDQHLVVDTENQTPQVIAKTVKAWLAQVKPSSQRG